MEPKIDHVTTLLDLLHAIDPEIAPGTVVHYGRAIRSTFGGQRLYIHATDPHREANKAAALADWRQGVPLAVASATHGIDRATLYRLIHRKHP